MAVMVESLELPELLKTIFDVVFPSFETAIRKFPAGAAM
jgi:hypothetical protein